MKKFLIIILLSFLPLVGYAQDAFTSFENKKDVTSVIVTQNMFKLLSKMDLDSSDPEAKAYLQTVENLDNVRVFTSENAAARAEMDAAVKTYLGSNKKLEELMRINDDGQTIKFFTKPGKSENHVSELLMHLNGPVNGKESTIIMSITGNIDLRDLSKMTDKMKVPGSEQLKKMDQNSKKP